MFKGVWINSSCGIKVRILNYGATINRITVPTESDPIDIVVYYKEDQDYLHDNNFLGAVVGPWANRIKNGRYKNGEDDYIALEKNEKQQHHLHGGSEGIHKKFWNFTEVTDNSVTLCTIHPKGLGGYPGNLKVEVTYSLDSNGALSAIASAQTDTKMPVNITFHPYFNLSQKNTDILDHTISVFSEKAWVSDEDSIPIELISVINSQYDLRTQKSIHDIINVKNENNIFNNGVDHCWMLTEGEFQENLSLSAIIQCQENLISLEVLTNQPTVQFYTGQHFKVSNASTLHGGKNTPFAGLCVEPQRVPNQPNIESLPPSMLNPNEHYFHHSIYRIKQK